MKNISTDELSNILKEHKKYLLSGGLEGKLVDLSKANLYRANLRGVDLSGANLYRADLSGADNINIPLSCPEKGNFIGFKKVRENLIVELQILDDSLRSSATGRKCRCSKAKVLSITNLDGTDSEVTSACSKFNKDFI